MKQNIETTQSTSVRDNVQSTLKAFAAISSKSSLATTDREMNNETAKTSKYSRPNSASNEDQKLTPIDEDNFEEIYSCNVSRGGIPSSNV